ncbi:MAG: hypothetical protein WCK26_00715 [Candidatus Saccharibacteria bacterium]
MNQIIKNNRSGESGIISGWMISTIGVIVLCLGLIGLSIWLYINYDDQKTNVDNKIDVAVTSAEKIQADKLEAKFTERDKQPNREFFGPEDYGLVTFDYPKTWSVYVNKDASKGGTFEAYLNPITVPPVSTIQQFAIRVLIEEKDYDKTIASYDALVKKGSLKASSVSFNGNSGTRLDGNFTKDIRGAAVLFKIRDKTLTIRTDAMTFIDNGDYGNLIATIKVNK